MLVSSLIICSVSVVVRIIRSTVDPKRDSSLELGLMAISELFTGSEVGLLKKYSSSEIHAGDLDLAKLDPGRIYLLNSIAGLGADGINPLYHC